MKAENVYKIVKQLKEFGEFYIRIKLSCGEFIEGFVKLPRVDLLVDTLNDSFFIRTTEPNVSYYIETSEIVYISYEFRQKR